MIKLLPFFLLLFVSCVQTVNDIPEKPPVIITPPEDIDMSSNLAPTYGTASLTYTGGSLIGTAALTIDGDLNTSVENATGGIYGPFSISGDLRVVLDTDFYVTTLSIKYFLYAYDGSTPLTGNVSATVYTSLDGSTWTIRGTLPFYYPSSGYDGNTVNLNVNTRIKYVRIVYSATNTAPNGSVSFRVYEIVINGDSLVSTGIRVKTSSGIITLAAESSLVGPLRIRKNGVTYSLALVDVSSSIASPLRVRTSAGTKAVAKL